jgi:glyoxylase-like metal-dependent hydrolase (beta-lactamase superfamily II)
MDIVRGVYLVERTRGSNVYLLVDSELALIDTGMPGNADRVLGFIKDLGREPKELAHIIITHSHIDHTGSVTELRRLTGAKVVANKDEVTSLAEGKHIIVPYPEGSRGVILRVFAHVGRFKPCPVDLLVTGEEVLPYLGGLRVIHTPGHTPGSISLFLEKSRVLFVGDTIINNEDRLSRPLPFGADRHESEQSLK